VCSPGTGTPCGVWPAIVFRPQFDCMQSQNHRHSTQRSIEELLAFDRHHDLMVMRGGSDGQIGQAIQLSPMKQAARERSCEATADRDSRCVDRTYTSTPNCQHPLLPRTRRWPHAWGEVTQQMRGTRPLLCHASHA
jgi:hypothetical protein